MTRHGYDDDNPHFQRMKWGGIAVCILLLGWFCAALVLELAEVADPALYGGIGVIILTALAYVLGYVLTGDFRADLEAWRGIDDDNTRP